MNNMKTMKRILFFLGLIIAAGCTQAQTSSQQAKIVPQIPSAKPAAPNIEKIPQFRILNQDSVLLTNANLKKDKPVMFIYFSPDCSHCQRMMYEMKPYMKNFSGIQVVMVTFTQTNLLKLLKEFTRDFSLASYPNFMVGTEYPNYVVQRYYQVATTPYIAIYDKKGKLVKVFDKAPKMEDLVAAAKKV